MIKKLICKIFGHRYHRIKYSYVNDGPDDRVIAFHECQRCGKVSKVTLYKRHDGLNISSKEVVFLEQTHEKGLPF